MSRTNVTKELACTESLKLLADYWVLRIIESLQDNSRRYCELQRAVGNVNPTTLSKKLDTLEGSKLIVRTEGDDGLAVYYELTPLGRRALPVLKAVQQFAAQAKA